MTPCRDSFVKMVPILKWMKFPVIFAIFVERKLWLFIGKETTATFEWMSQKLAETGNILERIMIWCVQLKRLLTTEDVLWNLSAYDIHCPMNLYQKLGCGRVLTGFQKYSLKNKKWSGEAFLIQFKERRVNFWIKLLPVAKRGWYT